MTRKSVRRYFGLVDRCDSNPVLCQYYCLKNLFSEIEYPDEVALHLQSLHQLCNPNEYYVWMVNEVVFQFFWFNIES